MAFPLKSDRIVLGKLLFDPGGQPSPVLHPPTLLILHMMSDLMEQDMLDHISASILRRPAAKGAAASAFYLYAIFALDAKPLLDITRVIAPAQFELETLGAGVNHDDRLSYRVIPAVVGSVGPAVLTG